MQPPRPKFPENLPSPTIGLMAANPAFRATRIRASTAPATTVFPLLLPYMKAQVLRGQLANCRSVNRRSTIRAMEQHYPTGLVLLRQRRHALAC
jgi:hypothetical protein